ncbi:gamma-glutamylcyclotransferase [Pararhodospirillum oryzae]|uniref:glutathione-specific gamma-glutamylcyclotransferase n=1 Tax=Pararhodospirillum oryzae TaxID=478448 RepID=A0A512H4U4_9PROT|nr:gamma-glutamylcyclotransferase [Pararhodospirillum oryzae]GEO80400.1 gamma-glutamylcyclotransferase [Pararhodospirillum oryzae]
MTDPQETTDPAAGLAWVFAYGSLMWRPDFPHVETHPAVLQGYHRAACILSTVYRGTPEHPGLVLGLKPGGECRGRAYRVEPDQRLAVLDALRAREMINAVYVERLLPVVLEDGRRVEALCYVADPAHPQYRGDLTQAEAAQLIVQGHGAQGSAREYLERSVAHLEALSVCDEGLYHLLQVVRASDGGGDLESRRGGVPF